MHVTKELCASLESFRLMFVLLRANSAWSLVRKSVPFRKFVWYLFPVLITVDLR